MGRKKKQEIIQTEIPPIKTCEYCGSEILDGRRCACRESRNAYAKELYEKNYGKERRDEQLCDLPPSQRSVKRRNKH